eukprot:CAMPEP_0196583288 /NCGR_PEP_ID=MMETSP1081-20130531/42848_1 /TAXON_ID=36882 /ORGANISM="Pyramimonas amylifera, Strain CCMP720" /LENGTH=217 /DNA_ID=CAMNT_0041904121 /DNA_START=24 /DNA_END=674 /DNA_ORIENTATION=+
MASQDEGFSILRKRIPFVGFHEFDVFETIHSRFFLRNKKQSKGPEFVLSMRHSESLQAGLRYSESLQQEDYKTPQKVILPPMKPNRPDPTYPAAGSCWKQHPERRLDSDHFAFAQQAKSTEHVPFLGKQNVAGASEKKQSSLDGEVNMEVERVFSFLRSIDLNDHELSRWLVMQQNMTESLLQDATESQLFTVGIPMGNIMKLLKQRVVDNIRCRAG